MNPMITRLVILALVLICGVGLYVAADTIETAPLKQAQQDAEQRFGTDLISLCKGATQTRGSLPPNSKIGAINTDQNTVFDAYDSALPTSLKATDKSDVNVLLCLKEENMVYDKSDYGDPPKYSCIQYERDLIGYLVDAKTGKTLDYKRFRGLTPPDCPDSTDNDLTETGDLPRPSDVIGWLTGNVGSNA